MKITLYTPDGTAETFRDCTLTSDAPDIALGFVGTDWNDKVVGRVTTLPFVIAVDVADEVTEIFETSPLVQDNIPIQ